ncbi:hypothetical protein ACOMHN_008073 [Nucella lapillus]
MDRAGRHGGTSMPTVKLLGFLTPCICLHFSILSHCGGDNVHTPRHFTLTVFLRFRLKDGSSMPVWEWASNWTFRGTGQGNGWFFNRDQFAPWRHSSIR